MNFNISKMVQIQRNSTIMQFDTTLFRSLKKRPFVLLYFVKSPNALAGNSDPDIHYYLILLSQNIFKDRVWWTRN